MEKKKGKSSIETIVEDGVPEAKYTRFGERIRQAIPGPMQCSVGCGGRNCKWENPAKWSDADQAIKGVFSSWVLEDVVAMSRPSTKIIKQYKMIEQFKKNNIRSIINLQRPGEHASCGPPLNKESLFTYRPQEFMDNDIFFYNFGWKDYGVTSLHTILDMVKVMSFALEEGRVAVHCHAGLGRTGVLIACYLVYSERMDPGSAILRVRKNRSNSIQTRGQIACITEFYQFLRPLRIVFPQVVPHSKRLTLKQFLIRQRHILHGFESRELRHTPKLIHVICRRLSQIAQGEIDLTHSAHAQDDVLVEVALKRCNTVADIKESLPGAFVNETKEETTHQCEAVLEFLSNSPTDVEAVLSPRVLRKGSARSVSSADAFTRPQSAGDVPIEQDESVFVPVSSIVGNKLSQDERTSRTPSNASLQNNEENEQETSRLPEDSNRSSSSSIDQEKESQSTDEDQSRSETEKDFCADEIESRDDQLERDVNEILGCNNNNNHSIIDASASSVSVALKQSNVSEDTQIHPVSQKDRSSDDEEQSVPKELPKPLPPADAGTELASQPPVSIRKMRHSAGRSETMLPTGLSTKNPRSSAKARPPSSTITSITTHPNVDDDSTDTATDDDDLDEIIDIGDDGESSIGTGSESEDVDTERTNSSGGKLSHSIASRVSWSHMKANAEDEARSEDEKRLLSASSKTSRHTRSRTPLMYRGEKNMTLIDGESSSKKTNERLLDSSSSSDEELAIEAKLERSSDRDETQGNTDETNSQRGGKTQTLGEHLSVKPPVISRINATKSLNDLTSAGHDENVTSFSRCSSSGDMRHPSPHGPHAQPDRTNPTNVGLAIAYKLIDDEWLWEKVYSLQVEVNNHNDAWTSITDVTDAYLLSSLMWSWVEHLAEPILTPKAVDQLLSIINRPGDTVSTDSSHVVTSFERALSSLDPGVSTTTKCLFSCILSFPALPRRITESMIQRTVAALTQAPTIPSGTPAVNSSLEQSFQNYINAKYEMSGRQRFIEETKEASPATPRRATRQPSTDSDHSQVEDTEDYNQLQVSQDEVVRRSAGSVHSTASSGSSNTGSVAMAAPRIIVN